MHVESIEFKRTANSPWERGYYVGNCENSDSSTILDKDYQPLPKNETGWEVYNYKAATVNHVRISFPEVSDIEKPELEKMNSFNADE